VSSLVLQACISHHQNLTIWHYFVPKPHFRTTCRSVYPSFNSFRPVSTLRQFQIYEGLFFYWWFWWYLPPRIFIYPLLFSWYYIDSGASAIGFSKDINSIIKQVIWYPKITGTCYLYNHPMLCRPDSALTLIPGSRPSRDDSPRPQRLRPWFSRKQPLRPLSKKQMQCILYQRDRAATAVVGMIIRPFLISNSERSLWRMPGRSCWLNWKNVLTVSQRGKRHPGNLS
jgi:hypothetical protein